MPQLAVETEPASVPQLAAANQTAAEAPENVDKPSTAATVIVSPAQVASEGALE